jgi:hypothetical protein
MTALCPENWLQDEVLESLAASDEVIASGCVSSVALERVVMQ